SDLTIDSEELVEAIDGFRVSQGLTIRDLAKEANIGNGTIHRLYHLEDPKGISKVSFAKVVDVLVNTPEQRARLFRLAGVVVEEADLVSNNTRVGLFARRVDKHVEDLGLDSINRVLLERFVLSQIDEVGNALKTAQLAQKQLQEDLTSSQPRLRGVKRLFSKFSPLAGRKGFSAP
ncbi:MAG: hypothetical protein NUV73_03135, partial [Candidatus Daviesbacteria bacterium]|nr:hypothetical protein [Candidatus Daviesbacteria bacterium]